MGDGYIIMFFVYDTCVKPNNSALIKDGFVAYYWRWIGYCIGIRLCGIIKLPQKGMPTGLKTFCGHPLFILSAHGIKNNYAGVSGGLLIRPESYLTIAIRVSGCTLKIEHRTPRSVAPEEDFMSEQVQDILTVKDIQRILKIGTNTAYNLIHSKSFPVIKIGQSYRIPKESFYAWLDHSGAAKL